MSRRSFLAPEVIQTSNMDCGPATLKGISEGFRVPISYGRLREACQTDVDGTSINQLEAAAVELGFEAQQVMMPLDHVLLEEACMLPAIAVTRHAGGTHFLVIWRRHGRLAQVMDPASGRRWVSAADLLSELYVHSMPVDAAAWCQWAESSSFNAALERRMRQIGIAGRDFVERASAAGGWRPRAALDAALRLTHSLVAAQAIRRGREARAMLAQFLTDDASIPSEYWSVLRHDDERVLLRGAVLVQIPGRLAAAQIEPPSSPELAAALAEAPQRPGLQLLALLRQDGAQAPFAVCAAMALSAVGLIVEALLFRGLFDVARELGAAGQRMLAMTALVSFLILLLALEVQIETSLLRMGRHLENRLRLAFLHKIPRLSDRYFQSRLKSDLAERSHAVHQIRHLPELGGELVRAVAALCLTVAAIAWFDPGSALLAAAVAAASLLAPLLAQPALFERDLRVRTHVGALSRYYFEVLAGMVPIRAHGCEEEFRMGHLKLSGEWARAAIRLQRSAVSLEALAGALAFGTAAWLLLRHLTTQGASGNMLLMTYWVLSMPVLAQEIAHISWRYPSYRNLTLRMIEPLGAREEEVESEAAREPSDAGAVSIRMAGVSVVAGGHTVLEDIDLEVPAGAHIAVVGRSGAGKSSLVGLLLGWYRPASGCILIDGQPLMGRLEQLRQQTVWVDPAVQLWNRSLYDNITYGSDADDNLPFGRALDSANLRDVLTNLPDGMQTSLGEGGGFVSGGEGQRVRLARAMMRIRPRLVILDEPFRGLDHEQRRELLSRARRLWHGVTLLCITHDVSETNAFDRVLVIESGGIAEDGSPGELSCEPTSLYRGMLEAETSAHERLWGHPSWKKVRLEKGRLTVL